MSTIGLYLVKKLGQDDEKIKQALEMLLIDRGNEFRELSNVLLRVPKSMAPISNSEQFILNFCLDVNEAFKTWSGEMELLIDSPQRALIILRQLSRDKTKMNELVHLLNLSYTLAEEFKEIYRRLK
ncbi:hypothetical protein LBMAG54_13310 [Nitrosopumilaceae archaeon]|nr:hypothetical protein EMGBD3_11540 [Nitrosarchaeum sp.]GDY16475.1 hypothetical protein LBMAG54_13310 [Nitrosopumilaceae archaeon]